ncbi:MAG TPA: hypothetical protein VH593_00255, partial [Ktedonobacteraceae bacterium]
MTIRPELIKECSDLREALAEGGPIKQLTRALIERCLVNELDAHLGYPKHRQRAKDSANSYNDNSRKTPLIFLSSPRHLSPPFLKCGA